LWFEGAALNPDEGFAVAKGALDAAKGQTSWINEQVGGGKLRMNPETAEAAAKHCESYAEQVGLLVSDASQLSRLSGGMGLGDYKISQDLQHHFQQKAGQPESGATALLRQLQEEMLNQADAFRSAAKDYRARDEQIAGELGKVQQ
jgi:hypothetical protein